MSEISSIQPTGGSSQIPPSPRDLSGKICSSIDGFVNDVQKLDYQNAVDAKYLKGLSEKVAEMYALSNQALQS